MLSLSDRDYSETMRYLGYSKISVPDETINTMVSEALREMGECLRPQAVYEIFPLNVEYEEEKGHGLVEFADVSINSADLARNLRQCSQVVIFAATIGPMVDSLIRRIQSRDSVKAAVLQASGAMFAEKLVDLLNEKIRSDMALQNKSCRPRFSPGYGDVSLQVQKDFFRLLPCTKIGLSLMNTLIMSPEKSVTAFIGIKEAV